MRICGVGTNYAICRHFCVTLCNCNLIASTRRLRYAAKNHVGTQVMDHRSSAQRYDLGIVLVHGIGNHRQGETLMQFGEPILECVHRRLDALWEHHYGAFQNRSDTDTRPVPNFYCETELGSKIPSYPLDATPMPSRRFSSENAYADIRLAIPLGAMETGARKAKFGGRNEVLWRMEETWWGEQVIEPKASQVIGWMLTRGPWVIAQFFYERFRALGQRSGVRAQFPALNPLRAALYAALAFVSSVLLQLVLLIFGTVSVIPIANKWVGEALLALSGILGDAYVLIVRDIQHAAIVERVRITIKAMRKKCDRVVVIPHSQGSGVVFDALTSLDVNEGCAPDHVISFGAGAAKLKTLFYAEAREAWTFQVAGWLPAVSLAAGTVVAQWMLWNSVAQSLGALSAGFVVAWCTYCALAHQCLRPSFRRCLEVLRIKSKKSVAGKPEASWTDYYASHDAVPMAGLEWATRNATNKLLGYRIKSKSIFNERSWLSDHVTYTNNRLEFCGPIVDSLLEWSGVHLPESFAIERKHALKKATDWLAYVRGFFEHVGVYALLAGLAFFFAARPNAYSEQVGSLSDFVRTMIPEWLETLPGIGALHQWVWAALTVVAYGFILVNIGYVQNWWRSELASRALREHPISERRMWHAVYGLTLVYAAVPLSLVAWFLGAPFFVRNVFVLGGVAGVLLMLFVGQQVAREREMRRRVAFGKARTRLTDLL
jgi:hypothetical protein